MLTSATCVAWNGEAMLITGAPGSGKSSLALACIDAGAMLVADDVTLLKREGGMLLASPPETVAGCLAIRHVGVFRLPHLPHASVRAAIEIESERPGWGETAHDEITIPKLSLPPGYRPQASLLRHLLIAQDGTRPDIWLMADDWRPERLRA